jgi:hypothetical protein
MCPCDHVRGILCDFHRRERAAERDLGTVTTSGDPFHKLYPEEFDDARIAAGGAYMGNLAATGSHHEALMAAVEEAFNAGVKVGREA